MKIYNPKPGLVIRYGFLWSHEAKGGAIEGSKDRPCAIILAAKRDYGDKIRVTLAPITHSQSGNTSCCIELPISICQKLGLDSDRQWLRFDELNSFEWPGFDLRAVPGTPNSYSYGMLPANFFEKVRASILHRAKAGTLNPQPIKRDD